MPTLIPEPRRAGAWIPAIVPKGFRPTAMPLLVPRSKPDSTGPPIVRNALPRIPNRFPRAPSRRCSPLQCQKSATDKWRF